MYSKFGTKCEISLLTAFFWTLNILSINLQIILYVGVNVCNNCHITVYDVYKREFSLLCFLKEHILFFPGMK